jgi:hypothetical protein
MLIRLYYSLLADCIPLPHGITFHHGGKGQSVRRLFILPNRTKLSCLLYADGLILLSRSKFGLQKSLDDLHSWSKKWLMEINLKKTQIMIIEKRKTRKASPKFNLGNRNIAIVHAGILLPRSQTKSQWQFHFSSKATK